MTINKSKISGSFRDPSGFLFFDNGKIFRQINKYYEKNYELLMSSGLYGRLVKEGLLVEHKEIEANQFSELSSDDQRHKIIQPEYISFISYPYEWCFGELKDAALTTLQLQKIALEYGMSLKDASAYNIQFKEGKPLLIDTLSFERYDEGKPWVAYKQFCQHFLAPLALMKYRDLRMNQLLKAFIDGIPLDLTSKLLPKRTHFKFSLLTHIHLHAKSQEKYSYKAIKIERKISKFQMLALIDNLESFIGNLSLKKTKTEWGDYYEDTNYSKEAASNKEQLIGNFIDKAAPKKVWDMGANTGVFSRIAAKKGISTISFDIDSLAVEKNYFEMKKENEKNILPLILDATNPSPAIGWENEERDSLMGRGPADLVMALALIHHLAISNNTPLIKIANFFAKISQNLIIEFVPKVDSNTQRLLKTREDIFPNYDEKHFEEDFSNFFDIIEKQQIAGSARTLYLMKKK
ncbi:MAG: SAM-dependent methyltransferase [Candidatus Gracilibacteria bacterium]